MSGNVLLDGKDRLLTQGATTGRGFVREPLYESRWRNGREHFYEEEQEKAEYKPSIVRQGGAVCEGRGQVPPPFFSVQGVVV